MAKREKPESSGPSQMYLISFSGMMTALLAFFIVLNSLATDQTGANLHSGTGSFLEALQFFGAPGLFGRDLSRRSIQLQESSPLYVVGDPENGDPQSTSSGSGPDPEGNDIRVIDREREQFTRFMNELEHLSAVASEAKTQGQVVFDFFNRLNTDSPHLSKAYRGAISQLLPLLRQDKYRVEIVVWATTPGNSAWTRATRMSASVRREIVETAKLGVQESQRIIAVGKPWLFKDVKRPVLTILVQKKESSRD